MKVPPGSAKTAPIAKLPGSLKDPFLLGCNVTECGMNASSYPVRPRGDWNAKVMWVGEAAGQEEEKNNCSFIGPAGKIAEETLNSIGLSLDRDFLVTNVTFCRPHPEKETKKQNRTPTVQEVGHCRPHFEKILTLHNPKLLVAVGGTASKFLLNTQSSIGSICSQFFGARQRIKGETTSLLHNLPCDCDIYTIWHPAYVLRNMGELNNWKTQLIRMRDYMIGRDLLSRQ